VVDDRVLADVDLLALGDVIEVFQMERVAQTA
jgi:hypothetical protein